jgi:hypothetical protein
VGQRRPEPTPTSSRFGGGGGILIETGSVF